MNTEARNSLEFSTSLGVPKTDNLVSSCDDLMVPVGRQNVQIIWKAIEDIASYSLLSACQLAKVCEENIPLPLNWKITP